MKLKEFFQSGFLWVSMGVIIGIGACLACYLGIEIYHQKVWQSHLFWYPTTLFSGVFIGYLLYSGQF